MILKRFVVCLFLALASQITFAQNIDKVFREGKTLFDQKDYALALVKLSPITSLERDHQLIPYASYYYAVSAYHSGDKPTAKSMFLQLENRFGDWDEIEEVYYWLAQINFENEDYQQAMENLSKIQSDEYSSGLKNMKDYHFSKVTGIEKLKALLDAYPKESVLANNLVNEILRLDVADQDIDLIEKLSDEYDISVNVGFEEIEFSPKKEVYNIGLFLPFQFREDSASLVQIEKTWPIRLYEGVQLGVEKLASEGINLNVLTYDTKRSPSITRNLFNQPENKDLDLIIGPVIRGPVQEATSFSRQNKINMVNPLSRTGELVKDNAYAFLYYPSNESLALKAAEYAKENFTENKNAAIFYSGPADRPRAELYRRLIEEDSFNVVIYQSVRPLESVKIQSILTDEEELDKDSLTVESMIAEMDSLREAGEEEWEIYDERDFVYDTLKVLPDSIGHIFVASDDRALSASAISGIASRPDSIDFIGSSKWLSDEQSVSFELLENIDATFTGSNLIEYGKESVLDFRRRYEERFGAFVKKDVRLGDPYIGYDIIVTFGRLMNEYGKYFQIALKRKVQIEGELTEAFDYRLTNDNRYIPILKIRNSQIEKLRD